MANMGGVLLGLGVAAGAAVAFSSRARAAAPVVLPPVAPAPATTPPPGKRKAKPKPPPPPPKPKGSSSSSSSSSSKPATEASRAELERARAAAARATELERKARVTIPADCSVAKAATLQRILKTLGASIAVDGFYGPLTRAAYAKAASARGLDTRCDPVTQALLTANHLAGKASAAALVNKAAAAELAAQAARRAPSSSTPSRPAPSSRAPSRPAPSSSSSSAEAQRIVDESRQIIRGERDAYSADVSDRISVADAQRTLNALGAQLQADGLYGPRTRNAWAVAARARGLPLRFDRVDGRTARVEPRTRRKLESDASTGASATVLPSVATEGYDPVNAKKQANGLAAHLRKMGRHYTRSEVSLFQTRAGIKADGAYGPMTREALQHFGVKNPPAAIYSGTGHYQPPQQ